MNGYLNDLAEYYRTAGMEALREAAPGQVFGPLSERAADIGATTATAGGFADTPLFHAVTVVLLISYVLVLYRYPDTFTALREYLFSSGSGRDELNDTRNDPLSGFSWGRLLLDSLFVCTAVITLVDTAAPDAAAMLTPTLRMLAVPAAVALFFTIGAYQNVLLSLSGMVTVSRPFVTSLLRVKTVWLRMAAVTLTPVLLLYALCPAGRGKAFAAIIALQVVFMAFAFLRETFLLFISKKLSIYHWILYLCIVEVFPLSLVCLLAIRG